MEKIKFVGGVDNGCTKYIASDINTIDIISVGKKLPGNDNVPAVTTTYHRTDQMDSDGNTIFVSKDA